MGKIKCIISYDGTDFSGYQVQPKKRTVQGVLEKALATIHKGEAIRVYASGRTDAGVHAKGQTIHFETAYPLAALTWKKALNALLPPDLRVIRAEHASDAFHARFDAVEKEYRYYVWTAKEPDVFRRNYVYHFPHPLNIDKMRQACRFFVGEHDFTAFSSARARVKGSKVRTLKEVACCQKGHELEFRLVGDGFLYNMVRIIVGMILDIGQGKREPEEIPALFKMKDRRLVGMTAPPQGLYLWEVKYEQQLYK